MPIGPSDLMIVAIALAYDLTLVTHNTAEFSRVIGLAYDLTLVTHNTAEFSRVIGLRLEDWE